MVHLLPDADGLVKTKFNTQRTGYFIANFDFNGNVNITPDGGGGIKITVGPGQKLSIPDKIGLSIQGGAVGSGHRNFVVFEWIAGYAA